MDLSILPDGLLTFSLAAFLLLLSLKVISLVSSNCLSFDEQAVIPKIKDDLLIS